MNNQMSSDLPTKIELGCGTEKPDGFLGVDIAETDETDLIQNLDEPDWDLPSNHFEVIRAIDVFEHLQNPDNFMEELYRIATPSATIQIRGPHISSQNWHDPTHRRLLGSRTFEHYTRDSRFGFYTDSLFEVVNYEIQFQWARVDAYRRIMETIANRWTYTYERTSLSRLFPATNIEFEITPIK